MILWFWAFLSHTQSRLITQTICLILKKETRFFFTVRFFFSPHSLFPLICVVRARALCDSPAVVQGCATWRMRLSSDEPVSWDSKKFDFFCHARWSRSDAWPEIYRWHNELVFLVFANGNVSITQSGTPTLLSHRRYSGQSRAADWYWQANISHFPNNSVNRW